MTASTSLTPQFRRLARARQIADRHLLWPMLEYMNACPIGTSEAGGDPEPMRRYMIVSSTDGGEDGWLEFEDEIAPVEEHIRQLLHDEWGLTGVWDLDAAETAAPLGVSLTVEIEAQENGDCPQRG